jgi:hypothetical protein
MQSRDRRRRAEQKRSSAAAFTDGRRRAVEGLPPPASSWTSGPGDVARSVEARKCIAAADPRGRLGRGQMTAGEPPPGSNRESTSATPVGLGVVPADSSVVRLASLRDCLATRCSEARAPSASGCDPYAAGDSSTRIGRRRVPRDRWVGRAIVDGARRSRHDLAYVRLRRRGRVRRSLRCGSRSRAGVHGRPRRRRACF